MDLQRTPRLSLLLFVCACFVSACAGDGAATTDPRLSELPSAMSPALGGVSRSGPSVVGNWETEPTLGQLGVGVVRYTFRADGTFSAEMELRSMNLPEPLRNSGSYVIDGDEIRFSRARSSVATFSFEGDKLVLVERDGDRFVLHRR